MSGLASEGRRSALGRTLIFFGSWIDKVRDAFCPIPYWPRKEFAALDVLIAVGLALVAGSYAAAASTAIDPRVYDSWNIYFQADGIRVLADMTDRFSDQWRTNVHPLVPSLSYPMMHALIGLGFSKLTAATILMAGCAGLTTGLLYLALCGLGLPSFAATIFTSVFLASATFVHWFAYVETYAFAMLTTTGTIFVLTICRSRPLWIWTVSSAGVLAITVTNWGLALAASFFRLSFRDFVKASVSALFLVVLLACGQKLLFPQAVLFFNPYNYKSDVSYTQVWQQSKGYGTWTPVDNIRGVLLTSAIAPPPATEISKSPVGDFTIVSSQHTQLSRMSLAGTIAVICWSLLLVAGVWGAIHSIPHRAVTVPVSIYVVFQTLLHSVYGEITFLYAGNFFPSLVFMTAFGYLTPLRKFVLGAAVSVVVLGGINNHAEFSNAVRMSSGIAAYLEATGTAICVPTCEKAPQAQPLAASPDRPAIPATR